MKDETLKASGARQMGEIFRDSLQWSILRYFSKIKNTYSTSCFTTKQKTQMLCRSFHVTETAHQLGIMFQLIYQLIYKTSNFDEGPPSNSLGYQLCIPTIKLNSDTIYLEILSDQQIKGSVHKTPPPLQMPIANPGGTCASDWLAIKQRFPWPPPRLGLIC